ncbi:ROK family protein [Streptomyces sp. SID5474]|nr:ROK family protein [Streptomyces sp. SID5474]
MHTGVLVCKHVAAGHTAVLYVSVGTGVGGALALDGRIVRGARGTAGEVGHLSVARPVSARSCACGRPGHVEAVASGPAIGEPARTAARSPTRCARYPMPARWSWQTWPPRPRPGTRSTPARTRWRPRSRATPPTAHAPRARTWPWSRRWPPKCPSR